MAQVWWVHPQRGLIITNHTSPSSNDQWIKDESVLDESAPQSWFLFGRVLVGNILGIGHFRPNQWSWRRVWQPLLNRFNAFQYVLGEIYVEAVDVHFQLFHGGRTNNV